MSLESGLTIPEEGFVMVTFNTIPEVIGVGVEKNLEECVFWYELAANGGDAQAQFATGWFLMTGTGVPQDERKGLKWIHKATFQGYQPAIDYCKEHGYKWY